MTPQTRREFLQDVSRGMLITGLGASLASELGVSTALATEGGTDVLNFGELRPLVALFQETPVRKLQPILVKKLKGREVTIKELTAAAALANAETFGGQDYVGFHTEMALLPAYQMAQELPKDRQALPILKVLYRNTDHIQTTGRAKKKMLHPVEPGKVTTEGRPGQTLQQATRAGDISKSEGIFAGLSEKDLKEAYNALMWSVQDESNVHRFVLAHRAYALIDVVGSEHAHTLLRQSVRFCAFYDGKRRNEPEIRKDVPKLLDQYRLLGKKLGTRDPGDAWVEKTCNAIYESKKAQAAEMVAGALAEGISPEVIGEAISLAANQLVLRQTSAGKSGWRTHGDSPGVHACDAANAWRNMIRVTNQRNVVMGLMVAAYHTARAFPYKQEAFPLAKHRAEIKKTDAKSLLQEAEEAIRSNEQGVASAAIQIYGEQGYALRPALDLLLRYSISEDGRLHAEKYYRTVVEEHGTTRKSLRWRQVVGLARVTASAYGYNRNDKQAGRAPGYEEACRLLGVEV